MKPLKVLLAVLTYCENLCGAFLRLFNRRETTSNEVQDSRESNGRAGSTDDPPSTQPGGENGRRVLHRIQTYPDRGHRTDYLRQSMDLPRVLSETFGCQKTSHRSHEAEGAEENDSVQRSCPEDSQEWQLQSVLLFLKLLNFTPRGRQKRGTEQKSESFLQSSNEIHQFDTSSWEG